MWMVLAKPGEHFLAQILDEFHQFTNVFTAGPANAIVFDTVPFHSTGVEVINVPLGAERQESEARQ